MALVMKAVVDLEHLVVMLNGSGSGGGGASGYTSGDVTIVTTQLGGNSSTNAFVTFEYYIPD